MVKMIPLISRLPREEGQGPMDLKSDCIKEIACPISIFCK